MSTSEVEVSAKEKKKSKKDRDTRNEARTNSDKDKEALEWAIKKSQIGVIHEEFSLKRAFKMGKIRQIEQKSHRNVKIT